jgi:type II secretory pathway pseudopilin PulG
MVVVGLLMVATMAIVPRMGRSTGQRALVEAASRLVMTGRTVRELAVSRRQAYAIELDFDGRGYAVTKVMSGGSTEMIQASWLKQERLPEGVEFGSVQLPDGQEISGGIHRIEFQPDGTSSGGVVGLVIEGGRYLVSIDPRNGQVTAAESEMDLQASSPIDLGD